MVLSVSLNFKQQRFVDEYLVDCNATQAATRAGYSAKTAYSQGERLLRHAEVAHAIETRRAKLGAKLEIDAEMILRELYEGGNAARADPKPDYKAFVRSRELIGKQLGMFTEHVAVEVSRSPEERELRILELMELGRQRALPEGEGEA